MKQSNDRRRRTPKCPGYRRWRRSTPVVQPFARRLERPCRHTAWSRNFGRFQSGDPSRHSQ
jgi:hypothetical protein